MTDFDIFIQVETPTPESVLLRIQGRLYMATLPRLEEQFEAVIPKCGKKVILDLSDTTYISSNCWSVFLILARRVKSMGGILLLSGMKGEVLNAYELLELRILIQSFPNVSAALSFLRSAEKTETKA